MNSTRHKSKYGETHKDRVFTEDSVLNRTILAEKFKEEFLDKMYYNNFDLMTQKEFEEAYKENNGKTDYSEVDFDIVDLMANRFNVNKHKYPKGNMLKPIDENQLLMALYRHWRKMFQPIPNDEETFEEHLAAILCNAQMIYQQRKLKNS